MDEKIKFYGALDVSARMLDDIVPELEALWQGGNYHMKPEELKRIAGYLSRIKVSHSRLRDTLKLFERLAALINTINDEKKTFNIQNLSRVMEAKEIETQRV